MNSDIKNKIPIPGRLSIPEDKTTNYYTMNPASYEKLIKDNITKTYKKPSYGVANILDTQSASIGKQLKLDDQIEKLAQNKAFITLNDHKPAFNDHPTCRLINPSKSKIGVVSKHILDETNYAAISKSTQNHTNQPVEDIDCTEVFIEKPTSPYAQRATWSEYKEHNTIKALVGITPSGYFSFLFKLIVCGGRCNLFKPLAR